MSFPFNCLDQTVWLGLCSEQLGESTDPLRASTQLTHLQLSCEVYIYIHNYIYIYIFYLVIDLVILRSRSGMVLGRPFVWLMVFPGSSCVSSNVASTGRISSGGVPWSFKKTPIFSLWANSGSGAGVFLMWLLCFLIGLSSYVSQ